MSEKKPRFYILVKCSTKNEAQIKRWETWADKQTLFQVCLSFAGRKSSSQILATYDYKIVIQQEKFKDLHEDDFADFLSYVCSENKHSKTRYKYQFKYEFDPSKEWIFSYSRLSSINRSANCVYVIPFVHTKDKAEDTYFLSRLYWYEKLIFNCYYLLLLVMLFKIANNIVYLFLVTESIVSIYVKRDLIGDPDVVSKYQVELLGNWIYGLLFLVVKYVIVVALMLHENMKQFSLRAILAKGVRNWMEINRTHLWPKVVLQIGAVSSLLFAPVTPLTEPLIWVLLVTRVFAFAYLVLQKRVIAALLFLFYAAMFSGKKEYYLCNFLIWIYITIV